MEIRLINRGDINAPEHVYLPIRLFLNLRRGDQRLVIVIEEIDELEDAETA